MTGQIGPVNIETIFPCVFKQRRQFPKVLKFVCYCVTGSCPTTTSDHEGCRSQNE